MPSRLSEHWRLALCFAIFAIYPTTKAFGQAPVRVAGLKVVDIVNTGEPASSLTYPAKCDTNGNSLVRSAGDRPGAGPILKISPDGKKVTRFSMNALPQELAADARMRSFAPGPGGEVVLLLDKSSEEAESYIVRYDSDGAYRSSSRIDAPFHPSYVGVFPSGDLLIGGRQLPPDPKTLPAGQTNTSNRPAFVGIFNNRGQLIREISLPKDLEPKKEPAETLAGEPYFKSDISYQSAIVLSSVETSDDGNVYLIRNTPLGPIYVLSGAGITSQIIRLVPPKDASLVGVKVSGRHLAAVYTKNKKDSNQIESVIVDDLDVPNRQKVGEYSHSDFHIGSILSCVNRPYYTFLGANEDGKLTLVRAAPE